MPVPDDDLIADLKALSTSQLRDAAAYVKGLIRRSSLAGAAETAEDESASPRGSVPADLFFSLDSADLRVKECDPSTLQILGANPKGKPFLGLIDSEYVDVAVRAFATVRSHKEVKHVRLRLKRADGSSFPASLAARWVEKNIHSSELIDVLCRDITFLKRLGNIEIFSEMLSIGIVIVDEINQIAFANSSAERLLGYEQGELTHQPLGLLFPDEPEESPPDQVSYQQGHIRQDRELNARKKGGSRIELKIGWSSIRLGRHRFNVASITDMTARKTIESELRKHEEQRALIFSEGLLGDFSWNIARDEVVAHPTIFKFYGAAPIAGPVPGDWFRSRQVEGKAAEIDAKWRSQLEYGGDVAVEICVNGDDGVTRWIDCRGIVVRDENGVASHVHGVNINITARKKAELERFESDARARSAEERLRTAMQFSRAAVWRWTMDDDSVEWVGPVLELTGRTAQDLNSFAAFRRIVFPSDVPAFKERISDCYAKGTEFRHEFRIVLPDGQLRWLAGRGGVLRDQNNRILGLAGVNFDITERKTVEQELMQSERDFRQLTNVVPQIVFTSDSTGETSYHNDRFYELAGVSPGKSADSRWSELLDREDRQPAVGHWFACVASGQNFERECRMWDRHRQEYRWYLVRAVPVRDADGAIVRWIGTSTDIHDQKTAAARLEHEIRSRTQDLNLSLTLLRDREEQLKKSLQEKDAMLREIHHRVKNNLQIVSSLLNMQAATATNIEAVAPLRDSERRISSMAMIHEQLYGTDDMQTVEFAAHAHWLSESLLTSMTNGVRVHFCLDLQPVQLTINQAIPCALILNELLTNAIKYAYPSDEGGDVTIRLRAEGGVVFLTVSDQGVGLPANIDPLRPKTLGMEIVQVLAHQIDGDLIVAGPPGASFTVRFQPEEKALNTEKSQSQSATLSPY
jgi:PAS domain S-box-containing protein